MLQVELNFLLLCFRWSLGLPCGPQISTGAQQRLPHIWRPDRLLFGQSHLTLDIFRLVCFQPLHRTLPRCARCCWEAPVEVRPHWPFGSQARRCSNNSSPPRLPRWALKSLNRHSVKLGVPVPFSFSSLILQKWQSYPVSWSAPLHVWVGTSASQLYFLWKRDTSVWVCVKDNEQSQTGHSQLHKHPPPVNPPPSFHCSQSASRGPLYLTSPLAADAGGFEQLLAVIHLSADRHTKKLTLHFQSVVDGLGKEWHKCVCVCVCVCVRGDGEVQQDSCQQAIVWRRCRADHTHYHTHTNSCHGNNGSSSLNKAASCQQGLLVSSFLNYKPLRVKGATCSF